MQMMKKNKGITLVSLTITIVLMIILTGIGVTTAYTSINDIRDNKLYTELGIVRQAIMEQYALAEAVGQIKILNTESPVSFWKGTQIENNEIPDFFSKKDPEFQEEYYYKLTPEDLKTIGIMDAKHTYIVNYSTGEVYNETKKTMSNGKQLYLPPTTYDTSNQATEDNTSFNDWEN